MSIEAGSTFGGEVELTKGTNEIHVAVEQKMQAAESQVVCYLCENTATHTVYFVRVCPQLCPTLCNPMDCSLPGSSGHGNFQARGLDWVAIVYCIGVFLFYLLHSVIGSSFIYLVITDTKVLFVIFE